MIKHPLNPRFTQAVLDGRKVTTIRSKPWPVKTPIMLYNWSGAAYRSAQTDVAPVVVLGFWAIYITHRSDGVMAYECGRESGPPIYETEGFSSQADMDEWFRPLVNLGTTDAKVLMHFRLAHDQTEETPAGFVERSLQLQCLLRDAGYSKGSGISNKGIRLVSRVAQREGLRDWPQTRSWADYDALIAAVTMELNTKNI